MEGQRDQVACSRSHSLCTVEPGTDPRLLEPNYLLKLKLQYFGHLMWRADSFEKTLMLGMIEDRRRRG